MARLLAEAQNGRISLKLSDHESQTTVSVPLPRYSANKGQELIADALVD